MNSHIPLPESKAAGEDERAVLLGYLAYHRAVLARKVDGVTDEQGRRAACPPSTLTLLGLLRHMTDVERWWFRRVLLAEDVPGIFADEAEWIVAEATVADSLAAYWEEIAVVDRHLVTADTPTCSAKPSTEQPATDLPPREVYVALRDTGDHEPAPPADR